MPKAIKTIHFGGVGALSLVLGLLIPLLVFFSTTPVTTLAQSSGEPAARAVLFYSPTCGHCHYVISEVLGPMVADYGDQLQIIAIDASTPAGGKLYQIALDYYQLPSERRGVPLLIVGDTALVGSDEIPEQFPGLVEAGLVSGGIDWPDMPGLAAALPGDVKPGPSPTLIPSKTASPLPTPGPTSTAPPSSGPSPENSRPVYLAYFFDPTCLECARVSAELSQLQARYANLVVRSFDLGQEAALNEAMCEKYGVPDEQRLVAPIIFIGQDCLTNEDIRVDRLEALIEDPATAKAPAPWEGLEPEPATATARIVERFNQFGALAVAGAGLLDGVNPCAFATIIFFVSYLALVGRKGREILLVGAAFTLAVFLTYLALGLGLAEVVRQVSSFVLIGRIIYGLTAFVCLILAGLSLWDYRKIRRGQLKDISLQLPKRLKRRVHQTIRSHSRMSGYVGAAFAAGVLVSIFELACTGQVYLPTIVFVAGLTELRLTAITYLLLYNVMFVVPLAAVFLVTYLGSSSRQLTVMFQTNAGLVKLLTAALFGLLGVWLGYLVFMV